MKDRAILMRIYKRLSSEFGPQHWWPASTPLEVVVGAILTQNTAWANVEKAIKNLRRERLLSISGLRDVKLKRLTDLIRPAGYFNQKAAKLKAFISFLDNRYGGSLKRMMTDETCRLRERLLGVYGVGPETADSILLYACGRPVFVVDSYTARVMSRHGIVENGAPYDEIQRVMTGNLPGSRGLFNEFHALLVRLGKEHCKKQAPRCEGCPLSNLNTQHKARE